MATRARIGVLEADGRVTSIYSHWDGYPSHVGVILYSSWRTEERVRALLGLGDLSALGAELGEAHDFDEHRGSDTCNAYGRDRGESNVSARTHDDNAWPDYGQVWEYLFHGPNASWMARHVRYGESGRDPWIPLPDAIVADGAALPILEGV